MREGEAMVLLQDRKRRIWGDVVQLGDLLGNRLQVMFGEVAVDCSRRIFSQQDQQNGCFAQSIGRRRRGFSRHFAFVSRIQFCTRRLATAGSAFTRSVS